MPEQVSASTEFSYWIYTGDQIAAYTSSPDVAIVDKPMFSSPQSK